MSSDDREYFLWGLLADAGWRGRIESVFVANVSSELPKPSPAPSRPCAIVREGQAARPTAGAILEGQYYGPGWSHGQVQVSYREPVAAAVATTRPRVSLTLDRSVFRPGDRVTIGLDARNPIGGAAGDLYRGPSCRTVDRQCLFRDFSAMIGLADPAASGHGPTRLCAECADIHRLAFAGGVPAGHSLRDAGEVACFAWAEYPPGRPSGLGHA